MVATPASLPGTYQQLFAYVFRDDIEEVFRDRLTVHERVELMAMRSLSAQGGVVDGGRLGQLLRKLNTVTATQWADVIVPAPAERPQPHFSASQAEHLRLADLRKDAGTRTSIALDLLGEALNDDAEALSAEAVECLARAINSARCARMAISAGCSSDGETDKEKGGRHVG